MYFHPSLLASAVLLSFSTTVGARVAVGRVDSVRKYASEERNPESRGSLRSWSLRNVFRKRQDDLLCPPPEDDAMWNIVNDADEQDAQTVCNMVLQIPPTTTETEYTPTITHTEIGPPTDTVTETTRVFSTTTTTQIASITALAKARRAVNVAAVAAARMYFYQVLDRADIPSATAVPTDAVSFDGKPESDYRLSTACACKAVEPTSKVIVIYTADPVDETVTKYRLGQSTEVITRLIVRTATVVVPLNQTVTGASNGTVISSSPTDLDSSSALGTGALTNAAASSSAESLSTSAAGDSSSIPILPASASTSSPSMLITSAPGSPSPTSSGLSLSIATMLPFSCPNDDNHEISIIAVNERWTFHVLCNKAAVTNDKLFSTEVSSESECAADCAMYNARVGAGACHAATFLRAPGAILGDCTLNGPNPAYVNSLGAVTVLLTGVVTADDNCAAIDFAQRAGNTSVDTSSIIASITSAGVAVSTPPPIFASTTGGVEVEYESGNSTGTDGLVYWSWHSKSASSMRFVQVYASDYTCTNNVNQTIVEQRPVTNIANITSADISVTTILNNGTVVVISGTSTSTYTQGFGVITPSAAPASTTSAGALFTTSGATATRNEASGGGVETPSNTPLPSSLSSNIGVTATSIMASGSGSASPNTNSTASDFSNDERNRSGRFTRTSSATGQEGNGISSLSVVPSQTSDAAGETVSGGSFTATSAGGFGSILPVPSNGSFAETLFSATPAANATGSGGVLNPSPSSIGALESVSSSTEFADYNEGGGYGPPRGSTSNVASPSSTVLQSTISSSEAQRTIVGSNGTATEAFGYGVVSPTGGSIALTVSSVTGTSNSSFGLGNSTVGSSILTASNTLVTGSVAITSARNSSNFFSTGGAGVETPATVTQVVTSEVIVVVIANVTVLPSGTGGSFIASLSGGVNTANFTQGAGSGAAPTTVTLLTTVSPAANFSASGTGVFLLSTGATAITVETASHGVIFPSGNSTFSGATAVVTSAQGSGAITPSANSTSPVSPIMPTNASSTDVDFNGQNRSGRFSRTSTRLNGTFPVGTGTSPPEASSTLPANSNSTMPAGTASSSFFENPGYPQQFSTSPSTSTINATSILGTGQPSITPPPASINSSLVLPNTNTSAFTDEFGNRKGSFSRSSSVSQFLPVPTANVTVWPGTANVSSATSNSSFTAGNGYGAQETSSLLLNSTSFAGTGSSAIPTPSRNSTASFTIPAVSANSTLPVGTGSSAIPVPPTNSSVIISTGFSAPSSGVPTASSNITLPVGTASSDMPAPSGNFTDEFGNRKGSFSRTSANSTAYLPTGTGQFVLSTGIPMQSANSTIAQSLVTSNGSSIPSATPTVSLNSTIPASLLTGSSFPSMTPSPSLNSTTEEACLTPSYSTSIETITHLVPIGPTSCAASPTANITSAFPTSLETSPPYGPTVDLSYPSVPTPTPVVARRLSGVTATQEQIDAACAQKGNSIFNPDFELEDNVKPFGWTAPSDPFISFDASTSDGQHTPSGQHSGRVLSAMPQDNITISQPLTLCPGKQYLLSAWNKQDDILSQCEMTYLIGDHLVFIASPQEAWSQRSDVYTAGSTPEDVSMDLNVRFECAGESGALVGANSDGFMGAEIDDLSLVQV